MPTHDFIVTPKTDNTEEKSVTLTIRIDRVLRDQYDELSARTNRSRNELINMALEYALEHLRIENE